MSQNCTLKIKEFELQNGAVICEHKYFKWHTLYYKPQTLRDLCVNHYVKRYMKNDKTELTTIPNWQLLCNGRYAEELDFVMLLCKDNVSSDSE